MNQMSDMYLFGAGKQCGNNVSLVMGLGSGSSPMGQTSLMCTAFGAQEGLEGALHGKAP